MDKSHEQHKQHTFDCFCKRMLKNEMRDYYAEINRHKKYEVSFSELSAAELEQLSAYDEYFADGHSFNVLQEQIIVKDDTIAEALAALPQNKRDIILLSYFLDMYVGDIGKKLNMVRSSVKYIRSSILKELKKILEEKGND